MNSQKTLIGVLLVLVVGSIIVFSLAVLKKPETAVKPTPSVNVACTMDAKMCPDGSYVGRIAPNCDFAMCPVNMSTTTTFEASIGHRNGDLGIVITPLEILEDSRCPIDVQCIQAGTVRVQAEVMFNETTHNIFILNQSQKIGAMTVTLTDVSPAPKAGVKIDEDDYVLTFKVVKN